MALKISFSLLLFSSLTFTLSSCGGSNFSRVDTGDVVQCPAAESYDPIPQELPVSDKVQKTSWPTDGAPHPSVTAGTYRYSMVQLYFEDSDTGFQYQVKQEPLFETDIDIFDQKSNTTAICVRNAMNMKALNVEMTFPSEVVVSADGTVKTRVKTLSLILNRQDPLTGTVSGGSGADNPPSKVTDDQNFQSQVYKLQADDGTFYYEMRLADESSVVKKWALVRFLLKP